MLSQTDFRTDHTGNRKQARLPFPCPRQTFMCGGVPAARYIQAYSSLTPFLLQNWHSSKSSHLKCLQPRFFESSLLRKIDQKPGRNKGVHNYAKDNYKGNVYSEYFLPFIFWMILIVLRRMRLCT